MAHSVDHIRPRQKPPAQTLGMLIKPQQRKGHRPDITQKCGNGREPNTHPHHPAAARRNFEPRCAPNGQDSYKYRIGRKGRGHQTASLIACGIDHIGNHGLINFDIIAIDKIQRQGVDDDHHSRKGLHQPHRN